LNSDRNFQVPSQPQSHIHYTVYPHLTNSNTNSTMQSPINQAALLAILATVTSTVSAGWVGDLIAMTVGTTLSLGLYPVLRTYGVQRRCHNKRYQESEETCLLQLGCEWQPENEKHKCTVGKGLGWPKYYAQLTAQCSLMDKQTCSRHDRCYYSGRAETCKVRVFNLLRKSKVDSELTAEQVQRINDQVQFLQQEQEQSQRFKNALGPLVPGSQGKRETKKQDQGFEGETEPLLQQQNPELHEDYKTLLKLSKRGYEDGDEYAPKDENFGSSPTVDEGAPYEDGPAPQRYDDGQADFPQLRGQGRDSYAEQGYGAQYGAQDVDPTSYYGQQPYGDDDINEAQYSEGQDDDTYAEDGYTQAAQYGEGKQFAEREQYPEDY
jgi:hypothetical protein